MSARSEKAVRIEPSEARGSRDGSLRDALVLAAVPVILVFAAVSGFAQSALLSLAVVLAAVGLVFVGFERSRPGLRQVMPAVVLGALAAAGRVLFAPLPDFKPVSAICILAGVVFGRRCGFMVGALAALVSNFFFGQGPWTPWQMYGWGLIGYLAGVLADTGLFDRFRPTVYAYGFLSGLLYGIVLDSWHVIGYISPLTWEGALLSYGAGLPFNVVHGVATAAFLLVLYAPWRRKLERIRAKYALMGED